jgi:hypothetical protein
MVTNGQDSQVVVVVEPWGRTVALPPGHSCVLEAVNPQEGFFWSVVSGPERFVSAFAEGGCAEVAITVDGGTR